MKDKIIEAGQNLKTLNIDYEKADGTRGWREVEPYSLKEVNGVVTLYAKNVGKSGIRSFKLESIHNIQITTNSYQPEWTVEL
jgi:predicted DNA-binding transcriptional regulator YafY